MSFHVMCVSLPPEVSYSGFDFYKANKVEVTAGYISDCFIYTFAPYHLDFAIIWESS